METPEHILSLRLVGGNLALDFANTAEGTPEGEIEREHLFGHEDLAYWGYRVGLLDEEQEAGGLVGRGRESGGEAGGASPCPPRLRGPLSGLFRAGPEGPPPPVE